MFLRIKSCESFNLVSKIGAIQTWVNEVDPSFWETVKTFNVMGDDRAKLNRDLEAAYRISEWVNVSRQDGHWKGKRSGSAEFLAYATAWAGSPDGWVEN